MPYLKIQTNRNIDHETRQEMLKQASALVANSIGKPEQYVMTTFDPVQPMTFAGSDEPCAYLELKSIGLSESKTAALSMVLCEFIEASIDVPANRVYIEFTDAPRAMWGWNKGTF
jgi:phenylpyruvate tautomerase